VPVKQILKYPRTLHLRGSTLQQDDDPDQVSMASLNGKGNCVFEEKADGANAGLSFDPDHGDMVLQSRGHSLDGGGRERQFDIFKSWAQTFERDFREALSTRYVAYGEWMAAKHSEFYDNLPHLFLTYDLYDREKSVFLSTPARAHVLDGLPIVPIHVVHEGWVPDKEVPKLVRNSVYKTAKWRESLKKVAEAAGQDPERVLEETDNTDLSEGVYLKLEDDERGLTIGRYKFVRHEFLQVIADSGSHWASRPIIQNQLAPGVDLYAHPARDLQVQP
jgi:RNA ligase